MDRLKVKTHKAIRKSVRSGKHLIEKSVARPGRKDKLLLNSSLAITPRKTCTKKEKIRQKHKNLMRKCTLIKKQCKEDIARKNRAKSAVIGDLKPLRDALPPLNDLFKMCKDGTELKTGLLPQTTGDNNETTILKTRGRFKALKSKLMQQVNSYEAILRDSEFRQNPRKVIADHIKYEHGLREE